MNPPVFTSGFIVFPTFQCLFREFLSLLSTTLRAHLSFSGFSLFSHPFHHFNQFSHLNRLTTALRSKTAPPRIAHSRLIKRKRGIDGVKIHAAQLEEKPCLTHLFEYAEHQRLRIGVHPTTPIENPVHCAAGNSAALGDFANCHGIAPMYVFVVHHTGNRKRLSNE